MGGWLLDIIKPYLDPDQCGMKGLSITHYLVKLLDFIHSTLDRKRPHSVLAACVDISKAFNRVDHSLVIQDLWVIPCETTEKKLDVPKIVSNFLGPIVSPNEE